MDTDQMMKHINARQSHRDSLLAALDDWSGRHVALRDLQELCTSSGVRAHLVMMRQPFLDLVVSGAKTIESRMTRNRMVPYGAVDVGDLLLLKEVGGPLRAAAYAERVWSVGPLDQRALAELLRSLAAELQLTEDWLEMKRDARFATLISLSRPRPLRRLLVRKRDRRGWVPLSMGDTSLFTAE